jgi:hypothetical protein
MKYIIFAAVMAFAVPAFSQLDCNAFKKGKFEYVDFPGTFFTIDSSKHMEYIDNGKYYIESSLKWTSDCTYVTVMKKCTVPDFPFKPGDEMTVTFTKNEEGIIYYTAVLKGEKTEGRVKKIE